MDTYHIVQHLPSGQAELLGVYTTRSRAKFARLNFMRAWENEFDPSTPEYGQASNSIKLSLCPRPLDCEACPRDAVDDPPRAKPPKRLDGHEFPGERVSWDGMKFYRDMGIKIPRPNHHLRKR